MLTNLIYIGSTVNDIKRWYNHKYLLNKKSHKNIYLQNAWNKYGEVNFRFEVIEIVEDKSKLIEREQFWINSTQCYDRTIGYNLSLVAGSTLGKLHSDITKAKISNSKKGIKLSPEHKEKIRLNSIGNKSKTGRKASIEEKEKLSLARLGNQNNRNKNKWPHEKGCKCKCNECTNIWKKYHKNRYAKQVLGVEF